MIDCNLLKEVYVNLLDQKEPKLNLESAEIVDTKLNYFTKKNKLRKVIKPTDEEVKLHKKYLKSDLAKNYYN